MDLVNLDQAKVAKYISTVLKEVFRSNKDFSEADKSAIRNAYDEAIKLSFNRLREGDDWLVLLLKTTTEVLNVFEERGLFQSFEEKTLIDNLSANVRREFDRIFVDEVLSRERKGEGSIVHGDFGGQRKK